jgi:hypothetical protein
MTFSVVREKPNHLHCPRSYPSGRPNRESAKTALEIRPKIRLSFK